MREKGIDVPDYYIRYMEFDLDQGKQIIGELMALAEPPTAFVIQNDLNALIVLTALSEMNIKVPDDVSIISFNNSMISKVANPPLTTIDTQIYQLGYEAASCLIEQVKDPAMFKKSVIIPTIILERKSCSAPKY